ncbi:DNA packaging protein [Salmonella enterica]|nr:DNA packaging protein [Salmonella enterica]EBY1391388.1 DNA packaging protein [Salmonella enterica subsp. enterica serovar Wagenia]EBY4401969.1 DNA packaging protein [Salmonella enterica subsp. enterica serovar Caracas]EEL2512885.1 DNA packaging protein [Salmonella enterica]EGK0773237.1 DNA packaging protein [Salmonella enterica]
MATKEENIQRLRELATRLGRAPDVSGSAAELSQRVMEWEEEAEAEAEAEHLPAVENDSDESIVPPGIGQRSERVLIRALRTLHICAIDPDSNRELDMVMAGNPARISQHDVDELIAAGLIIEL